MAGAFTAVDLSKLPFPDAVEQISFEQILSEMIAMLQSLDPTFNALVESDPAYKILEVAAYRETLIRQRNNEAIKAVTLAYAEGSDLDQIAANYNVERLVITPADPSTVPPTPAVMETDDSLRRRVQLSFEGFSTAGPEGAYIFHSLGADARVLDASAFSPTPGDVEVAVLSKDGDGTAPSDLIAKVNATLSADDVRPLTDHVTVKSAEIVNYSVTAVLTLYPGPDADVVLQAALDKLDNYIEVNHRLGRDITISGVMAALHQEGVMNVALSSPSANVVIDWDQVSYCTGINVTVSGSGE